MSAKIIALWAIFCVAVLTPCRAEGEASATAPPVRDAAPGPVAGDEPVLLRDYVPPTLSEPPSTAALLGRVIGSVLLVSGLIVVGVYLIKRVLRSPRLPGTAKKQIHVIEGAPLGNRCFIYLVKVPDRVLVLGASNEQVRLLSEISDTAIIRQMEAESDPASFRSALSRFLSKKLDAASVQPPAASVRRQG